MDRGVGQRHSEGDAPMTATERAIQERMANNGRGGRKKKSFGSTAKVGLVVAGVIVALLAVWLLLLKGMFGGTFIDGGKYQAVFFTNGQVYFGKLHEKTNGYMELTDVFYIQTKTNSSNDSKNPQDSTLNSANVELIKLGDEIHGPEDSMIFSKDQVLFFENLKPEGNVSTTISKYKEQQ